MLCDRYFGFHHCTGSQQSASRGRVLAFYRIAPCLTGEGQGILLNDDILNVRELCCGMKLVLVEIE